jgi:hypothetical protein
MMIDQFFTNADYYKNKEFQKLMRNWNYYLKQDEVNCSSELLVEVKRILMGDFYRKAKEWLFVLDEIELPNYESNSWRIGLE